MRVCAGHRMRASWGDRQGPAGRSTVTLLRSSESRMLGCFKTLGPVLILSNTVKHTHLSLYRKNVFMYIVVI